MPSTRRTLAQAIAASLIGAGVVSCGSGGGSAPPPPTGGGGNTGGGGTPPPTLQANFDSIQTLVFDALCVGCHIGASAPAGLRLDAANSFALLVGVTSAQNSTLQRVNPGNPNDSYLIQKLEGTASVGATMPLNGTPLPTADVATIRQWITDGAQPSASAPPSSPIRVSSMSPLPGSTELRLPTSVMVIFDREVDANTVNDTTFIVERSGGDGTFGDGNEIALTAASISIPIANPQSAVFDLTGAPAVEDTYRVRLVSENGLAIADLDANGLDGEFTGALPSGDGTTGGTYVANFTIQGVQPTLQSIQDNIFTTSCAGCHTGPGGVASLPATLDLTNTTASSTNLINVASIQVPTLDRVDPGNPDGSYLIQKLEGTATVGLQMPRGGTPLDQATIDAVREWITNGATD